MFKNKSLLITGGTGSFGKSFLKYLINNFKGFNKIIIFSRDELKQFEMSNYFSENRFPFIRYFLGDVRDLRRLNQAMEGIDYVIHAAALKQVTAAEYNPFEVIKTNVIGAQNIIEACLNSGVKKVIALSTDKAVAPINLYGATKLCSDKLFISANNITGKKNLLFSVVRYGNVMGSRGSVIPKFLEQKKNGILHITDKRMTRFNITMDESIKLVLWALKNSLGGEIFVPKIPSFRILDLAKAIAPNAKIKITGFKLGEKIHEDLITTSESEYTVDLKKHYAILTFLVKSSTNLLSDKLFRKYMKLKNIKKVKKDFSYRSDTNSDFLKVEEIRELIKKQNIFP
jgi:UDP-N-acetylglucosamine 4,6-dehydratase (inverting)|tara:strand:- start:1461 stop:2486 length:1026 start_codon:yes stop_codon:yes gene_type:complete